MMAVIDEKRFCYSPFSQEFGQSLHKLSKAHDFDVQFVR